MLSPAPRIIQIQSELQSTQRAGLPDYAVHVTSGLSKLCGFQKEAELRNNVDGKF